MSTNLTPQSVISEERTRYEKDLKHESCCIIKSKSLSGSDMQMKTAAPAYQDNAGLRVVSNLHRENSGFLEADSLDLHFRYVEKHRGIITRFVFNHRGASSAINNVILIYKLIFYSFLIKESTFDKEDGAVPEIRVIHMFIRLSVFEVVREVNSAHL